LILSGTAAQAETVTSAIKNTTPIAKRDFLAIFLSSSLVRLKQEEKF
jgi:hypothetical protein